MSTKRKIIGFLLGGVAVASAATAVPNYEKKDKEFKENAVIECVKDNKKIILRGNADIRGDVDGEIVMANTKPQKLKVKKGKKIKKLVIGESPAEVELESDLWVGELVINEGVILHTNGKKVYVETGATVIHGSLDAIGSQMDVHDVWFGGKAEFTGAKEMISSGTGHKIVIPATYAKQATYSGSTVITATGTLLTATGSRFTSYVYVAPILSHFTWVPASYSGSLLLDHRRDDAVFVPPVFSGSLMVTGSGWNLPVYKPSVSLGNFHAR